MRVYYLTKAIHGYSTISMSDCFKAHIHWRIVLAKPSAVSRLENTCLAYLGYVGQSNTNKDDPEAGIFAEQIC
jgi:hypothetical protein